MKLQKIKPKAIQSRKYGKLNVDCFRDRDGRNVCISGADNLTISDSKRLLAYLKQAIKFLEAKSEKS